MIEGGGERLGERVSSEAGYPASIYIGQLWGDCGRHNIILIQPVPSSMISHTTLLNIIKGTHVRNGIGGLSCISHFMHGVCLIG